MVQMPLDPSELLSVGKAAKQLRTSRWSIYRWVKTGKLLGVEISGILFVPMTDIKRYRRRYTILPPERS